MTLQQLYYFRSVARSASFTKAAREWFVSQSAISRQIGQLEQELDVALLERNTAHVRLTAAGELFYARTSELCAALQEAVEETRRLDREQRTHLNLGIPSIIEQHAVMDRLQAFHAARPEVTISTMSGSRPALVTALVSRQIDLLIAQDFDLPDLQGLAVTVLSEDHFVWLLPDSHPLAGESRVGPEALRDEALILIQETPTAPTAERMDLYYRRLGLETNRRMRAGSLSDFFMLVGAGIGIGLIPSGAVHWIKSDMRCVEIDGPQWDVRILAIARPESSSANVQALLQARRPG